MAINAYLKYLQLFQDHLLLSPLLLCDAHNLQDCAYIWNKCASRQTHRCVSICVGHSISCPVDKANLWGTLLSNHIHPICIPCCLQSSPHTEHLWFYCMAEPTQAQAAPGRDGPALLLHKHTNTSMLQVSAHFPEPELGPIWPRREPAQGTKLAENYFLFFIEFICFQYSSLIRSKIHFNARS